MKEKLLQLSSLVKSKLKINRTRLVIVHGTDALPLYEDIVRDARYSGEYVEAVIHLGHGGIVQMSDFIRSFKRPDDGKSIMYLAIANGNGLFAKNVTHVEFTVTGKSPVSLTHNSQETDPDKRDAEMLYYVYSVMEQML